jgi:nucleoside 2-deoxyribosyltransferase
LKIVLCGSYGDLDNFLKVLANLQQKYGASNVFPDSDHIEKSMPCIFAHHVIERDTAKTTIARSRLMESYFRHIDSADLVVLLNEKDGEEYYGVGTTIELGYAIAKGKRIRFTRQPTDSNILSLLKTMGDSAEGIYARIDLV